MKRVSPCPGLAMGMRKAKVTCTGELEIKMKDPGGEEQETKSESNWPNWATGLYFRMREWASSRTTKSRQSDAWRWEGRHEVYEAARRRFVEDRSSYPRRFAA